MRKDSKLKISKKTQLEYAMRTLEYNPDGVFWSDINGVIVYVNKAACEKLGYSKKELIGMSTLELDSNITSKDVGEDGELIKAVRKGDVARIVTSHKHHDGHIIPVEITMGTLETGDESLGFSFARDISEQLEEKNKLKKAYSELEEKNAELDNLNKKLAAREARLEYLAYHDLLTGLPNRSLLMNNLSILMDTTQTNNHLAMLFIDLDNFKFVNDSLGHCKGDEVLKDVCQRVNHLLKDTNQLYRIGGDEFVALLHIHSTVEVNDFAEAVMECLRAPFQIDIYPIHLSCSIGIAIFPEHTVSSDELLTYSDAAMYKAKVNGKNKVCLFNKEIGAEIANKFNMRNKL